LATTNFKSCTKTLPGSSRGNKRTHATMSKIWCQVNKNASARTSRNRWSNDWVSQTTNQTPRLLYPKSKSRKRPILHTLIKQEGSW
jgi:hypothetical protein